MNNKEKYIQSLNNIKADEKLVNETIQKIRQMKIEKANQEAQSIKNKPQFNKLKLIRTLSIGVAATFVIAIVGTQLIKNDDVNNIENVSMSLKIAEQLYAGKIENYSKEEVLNQCFSNHNTNNFKNVSVSGGIDEKNSFTKWGKSNKISIANEIINCLYKVNGEIYTLGEESDKILQSNVNILDNVAIYDIRGSDRYTIMVPKNTDGVIILQISFNDDPDVEFNEEYLITLTQNDKETLEALKSFEKIILEEQVEQKTTQPEENTNKETNTNINIPDKKIAEQGKIVDGEKVIERTNSWGDTELYLTGKGTDAFKLCIKLKTDSYAKRGVDVSKINSDTKYEINSRVLDYITNFNVKTQCSWIAYLLDNGTVEYLIIEESIQKGEFKNNYKLEELTNIVDLEDENTGVYAVKSDGTKIELKNKINEIVNQKEYYFVEKINY